MKGEEYKCKILKIHLKLRNQKLELNKKKKRKKEKDSANCPKCL